MVYRPRPRRSGASVYLDAARLSDVFSVARPEPLPRIRPPRQPDEPLPWFARANEARLSAALRGAHEAPHYRLGAAATGERGGPGAGDGGLQPEQTQGPPGAQNSEAESGGRTSGLDEPGRTLR